LHQEIFKDNLFLFIFLSPMVMKLTGEPAGTPIGKDTQLSALRQVVKKEETSVEMKQRDENLASYTDTAPATESWPDSIPCKEEKILVNNEAVCTK